MLKRNTIKFAFVLLTIACAFLWATPAQATLTQRCNWGVGTHAPTANHWPLSTQVMMMPTVMDFGIHASTISSVAFISFENSSQANRDGRGVLRIIDGNCNEIATYPNSSSPPPPAPCPLNLNTVPDLACRSGLAVGNLDNSTTDVEIVGTIGGPTLNHKQIIAFNLVGPLNAAHLVVKWCSPPLTGGDIIPGYTAAALAQLDTPPDPHSDQSEIIVDDKVFNYDGTLRYSGFNVAQSHAVVVANPSGSGPQVITGRRMYKTTVPFWTGTVGWQSGAVSSSASIYPAVAEIVAASPGPEIVVTDTLATTVRVLSSVTGAQLASAPLPNPGYSQCGGPPMIGNVPNIGTVIGVASCSRYTLFKYNGTLSQVWTTMPMQVLDQSGQTTSTLYNTLTGARIYYNDQNNLWVFNGANGNVLQSLPNSSATTIEGPVIAAFDTGSGLGSVIVAANNYNLPPNTGQRGVRIFDDPSIGPAVSYWNQHTYHYTNITNSHGAIPIIEPKNWLAPARNTYRVQQWP